MQNRQKVGIAMVAIIVAVGGWQLVHARASPDGDSPATAFSYNHGGAVMPSGPVTSIGAETVGGPRVAHDPLAVTSALTASMSLTPGATDVGRVVIFSATASGGTGTYTYNWSFGDGASDRSANTFHAYTAPRTYPVVLWVNDSAGSSAKSLGNVTVNPLPVGSASASPAATDVGSLVGFSGAVAGGTSPLSYAWNFEDESSSTALRP
ncbi:MAG TPA: PKD domain-containing protein, partial [Thermoplasmata archaeon]|nr:PKD domain-containing protein [Thermoplasmata archaeon]